MSIEHQNYTTPATETKWVISFTDETQLDENGKAKIFYLTEFEEDFLFSGFVDDYLKATMYATRGIAESVIKNNADVLKDVDVSVRPVVIQATLPNCKENADMDANFKNGEHPYVVTPEGQAELQIRKSKKEYVVIEKMGLDKKKFEKELCKMNEEGWEVHSFSTAILSGGNVLYTALLERNT